jgi:hypothetical protein
MPFSTTAEACAALRISKVRLNELARKSKLPRGPRPNQWDIEACRRALGRNLDVHQVSPARGEVPTGSIGRKGPAPSARQASAPLGGDTLPRGSLAHAQLLKTQAQAAVEGMKARVMDGKLLDSEEVRAAVAGMVIAFRAKILVIGDELADKVAACSDAIACRELIDGRLYEALAELSEYPASA